jgi:hypothetical protein
VKKKLKSGLGCFAVIAVVLLAVLFGTSTSDALPDNAKMLVFPSYKIWIPDRPKLMVAIGESIAQANGPIDAANRTDFFLDAKPATLKDILPGGKYEDYKPFPGFEDRPDEMYEIPDRPLFFALFFHKPRWKADGTWNW